MKNKSLQNKEVYFFQLWSTEITLSMMQHSVISSSHCFPSVIRQEAYVGTSHLQKREFSQFTVKLYHLIDLKVLLKTTSK